MNRRRLTLLTAAALSAISCSGGSSNADGTTTTTTTTTAPSTTTIPAPPLVGGQPLAVVIDEASELSGDLTVDEAYAALPVPPPDASRPYVEEALVELQRNTVLMARALGVTTAECEGNNIPLADGSTTCTVTYEGVPIEWEVTLSNVRESGAAVFFDSDYEPRGVLLRADIVYDQAWRSLVESQSEPATARCAEMPAVQVITAEPIPGATGNEPGSYVLDTGYDCQFLDVSDGRAPVWRTVSVHLEGSHFDDIYHTILFPED